MPSKGKVFLSYSSADVEFANRLQFDLQRYGISAWQDKARLVGGEFFPAEIEKAISESHFFLLVMSPSAFESNWVKLELQAATTAEASTAVPKLIPLLLEDCTVPLFLRSRQHIDFRRSSEYFAALDQLLGAVLRRHKLSHSPATALFDTVHSQSTWDLAERPLLNLDYRDVADILQSKKLVTGIPRRPITLGQLDGVRLLILVSPRNDYYSKDEAREIVAYVRMGGSLLALSYYFGDRHHKTNLASITEKFGMRPREDRVWDGASAGPTPLHTSATVTSRNSVLSCADVIYTPLTCSINVEPPAQPLLESLATSRTEEPDCVVDGMVRSVRTRIVGKQCVGAYGEFGHGKVITLGSWQALTVSSLTNRAHANRTFGEAVLSWLLKREGSVRKYAKTVRS